MQFWHLPAGDNWTMPNLELLIVKCILFLCDYVPKWSSSFIFIAVICSIREQAAILDRPSAGMCHILRRLASLQSAESWILALSVARENHRVISENGGMGWLYKGIRVGGLRGCFLITFFYLFTSVFHYNHTLFYLLWSRASLRSPLSSQIDVYVLTPMVSTANVQRFISICVGVCVLLLV